MQAALEQYRSDNGSYPISQSNSLQVNNQPCKQPFIANNITYLKLIPCDPLGAASNFNNGDYYYYSADGKSYTIGVCLERKADPDGQATINKMPTKIYRANYNFRAVLVPQGSSVIELTYLPMSFLLGIFVSSISIVFLLCFIFLPLKAYTKHRQ